MANENKNPKVMPNNFEAEQSLLGAILIDNNVALATLTELRANYFYYTAHRTLYEAMLDLQRNGKPIDIVTLADKLIKDGNLEGIGGIGYLTDLTNVLPSSANYMYYFDIITRNGMLRNIINASNEIIENSYKSDDSDMALSYAEKKIFDLSDSVENKDLVHINDSVNETIHKFEDVLINPDGNKGLLTYFNNIDNITNGYVPGQMIVLAARPGCGKTSYAMNIVANIVRKCPEKVVAVFNLEMSISELTQRILLTMAQVPHESVTHGASADEFKRMWQAKKILEQSNLYIDDTTGTTPEQIMSKCRRLKQLKKRLDFVVIDYLQLLKSHTPRSSLQQEVSDISRSIKIMAKELKVPVFILSQMSRDLEKRTDPTPKLSDLRDSGAIEQDADQVYFLIKDKAQENDAMEIIDLVICKNRTGQCGTIHYKWEGNMVKFTPVNEETVRMNKYSPDSKDKNINSEKSKNYEGKDVEGSNSQAYFNDSSINIDTNVEVDRVEIKDMTPPPVEQAMDWKVVVSDEMSTTAIKKMPKVEEDI